MDRIITLGFKRSDIREKMRKLWWEVAFDLILVRLTYPLRSP
jgi:hypothetical protein